jgi:hypothetical protein
MSGYKSINKVCGTHSANTQSLQVDEAVHRKL